MTATRSILAPLTATFTPPALCSTFGILGGLSSVQQFWQGQTCSGGGPHDASTCWPPALVPVPSPTPNLNGWGIYSPGLHCPIGYYSACTQALQTDGLPSQLQSGTSYSFQFPLTVGETAIGCCPIGLTCTQTQGYQTCGFVQTDGPIEGMMGFCNSWGTSYAARTEITVGDAHVTKIGTTSSTMTFATASLYGPLIQIVFQSSDIVSAGLMTSSSIRQSPIAIDSIVVGSAPTGYYTNYTTSDHKGLSPAAMAGIGVGITLGVLALLVIAALFFLRRRRWRSENKAGPMIAPISKSIAGNCYGQAAGYTAGQGALHIPVYGGEMQQCRHCSELQSSNRNAELDADTNKPPAEFSTEDYRTPASGPSNLPPSLPSSNASTSSSIQPPDASRLTSPRY